MSRIARAAAIVVILLSTADAIAQVQAPAKCPIGFSRNEGGNCMRSEALSYLNCVTELLRSRPLQQEFSKTLQETKDDKQFGGTLDVLFKNGGIDVALNKATKNLVERNVQIAPIDTSGCKQEAKDPTGSRGPKPTGTSSECGRLDLIMPYAASTRAGGKERKVTAPLDVVWRPDYCEAVVELVSATSNASGDSVGTGVTLIRLTDPRTRKVLSQQWVNIVKSETPSVSPPPPPPAPIVHVSGSTDIVHARLIDDRGGVRTLANGDHVDVPSGDYKLAWSNSSREQKWSIKRGSEYWVHQEVLPARVQLLPPSAPNASLSADGTQILVPQPRELSASNAKLNLSLSDTSGSVANLQIAPKPEGGIELQVEPTPRSPSYAPIIVGCGGAAIATVLWVALLRPAANDAQDRYNNLGPSGDFAVAHSDLNKKSIRADVALGVAITSLVVGAALEAWELWGRKP